VVFAITFTKATTLNFCSLSIIWTCDNFIYGIMVVFVSYWNLFFFNICSRRLEITQNNPETYSKGNKISLNFTNSVISNIVVGGGPIGILANPTTDVIYVCNSYHFRDSSEYD
jgi:hypothetical protein